MSIDRGYGIATSAVIADSYDLDALIADTEAAKIAAEAAQVAAETAQSAAETAETNAETAETNAETAETNAETAQTAAETAKTAAQTAQTAAETAETNAETAQAAAEAAQSAAETAQTGAETAETNAETAQAAAETAQAAAEAALDSFDDTYLGAKSSEPTLDNDGNALADGALYFNTTDNILKVYDLATTTWLRTTPTSAEQTNIDTVSGISSDVTTVAGISSDVTTVAADGTDIGTVAGISSDVTTVSGISSDVTTVAGDSADIQLLADNIGTISSKIGSVVEDTTPQLGGDLDLNSSDITGTGNINITGDITLGDTNPTITFTDTSVTNLNHSISSASDNLLIQVDANNVDSGSRVQINDGLTEVARFSAGSVDVTGNVTTDTARSPDVVDNDGSFDLDAGTNFTCTPTGNITLTFTNIPDGQSGTIVLINTGGHTISAAATTKVMGADMLTTITTAGTYVIGYISDGTNVRVYNSAAQQ